jgi:hypothetical protein
MTPGQAAYEAYFIAVFGSLAQSRHAVWRKLDAESRAEWEAAAQAAVKAGTATFHDGCEAVIAGLEASRNGLRDLVAQILGELDGDPVWGGRARDWRERAGLEQP